MDERRRAAPERDADHHPDRGGQPQREGGRGPEQDQPPADPADRASQMGSREHDHGRREGEAHRGIDRRRGPDRDGVGERRAAPEQERADDARHDGGRDLVPEQREPGRPDDGCDDQHQPPEHDQDVARLPEPTQEPGQRLDDLGDSRRERRRVRDDRHQRDHEDRREQQDRVRGPTSARGIGRGGEEPHVRGRLPREPSESSEPLLTLDGHPARSGAASGYRIEA